MLALLQQPVPSDTPRFRLSAKFSADTSPKRYQQAFATIQRYILAGDCYQVNFAQRFRAPCQGEPWAAYRALRAACPTPFAGYLRLSDDSAILSLSPERFLRLHQGAVETRPIKGTRPRHSEPGADAAMADELLVGWLQKGGGVKIDIDKNDTEKLSFKVVTDPKPTTKEKPEPEAVE